jgi:hypothetical protein
MALAWRAERSSTFTAWATASAVGIERTATQITIAARRARFRMDREKLDTNP